MLGDGACSLFHILTSSSQGALEGVLSSPFTNEISSPPLQLWDRSAVETDLDPMAICPPIEWPSGRLYGEAATGPLGHHRAHAHVSRRDHPDSRLTLKE